MVSYVEDNIEKLYKNFGILADDTENISKHEKEYLEILAAVKGAPKEKRLASQFIARFFKSFPNLTDQALEAQLDLCEDDDVAIRKQAIKDLTTICKDNKEQIPKIADILAQLLQAEDAAELVTVQNSLVSLLGFDAKGTLNGIYSQLLSGDETVRERCIKFISNFYELLSGDETVRERCIKFISKNVFPIDSRIIDKSAEDFIIIETKKVLQDVTGDEFVQLLNILSQTRLKQTPLGQKEIVDMIADQAELDHPFDPNDESQIERIIHCTHCALPYFNSLIDSNRFVYFLINNVLQRLDDIPVEIPNFPLVHLELLKIYTECCAKSKSLDNSEEIVEKTVGVLTRYVPLPPKEEETTEETNFEFSLIEATLCAIHELGRKCPDVIRVDSEMYKDLKLRLHYLACHVQGYMKPLKEELRGGATKADTPEAKLKILTLKTTSNISIIIKDLFHNPPQFKADVIPSWKVASKSSVTKKNDQRRDVNRERKRSRSNPISKEEGSSSKVSRSGGREIYQPPSGKFSTKVSGYGPSSKSSKWTTASRSSRGSKNFRSSARWRY